MVFDSVNLKIKKMVAFPNKYNASCNLINYVVNRCLYGSTRCSSNPLKIFLSYTTSTENISICKILSTNTTFMSTIIERERKQKTSHNY